jgi:hypothetical protein
VSLVSIGIAKLNPHAKLSTRVVLMSLALALLDIPMVYVVVVMVLGLPFTVYLLALPIYMILQLIPTTFLSYAIIKAIVRSGLLRYA